jgi:hypothetical protein
MLHLKNIFVTGSSEEQGYELRYVNLLEQRVMGLRAKKSWTARIVQVYDCRDEFFNPYSVYQIRIETNHYCYYAQKRFSDFLQLEKEV